jgi:TolA-binding protein
MGENLKINLLVSSVLLSSSLWAASTEMAAAASSADDGAFRAVDSVPATIGSEHNAVATHSMQDDLIAMQHELDRRYAALCVFRREKVNSCATELEEVTAKWQLINDNIIITRRSLKVAKGSLKYVQAELDRLTLDARQLDKHKTALQLLEDQARNLNERHQQLIKCLKDLTLEDSLVVEELEDLQDNIDVHQTRAKTIGELSGSNALDALCERLERRMRGMFSNKFLDIFKLNEERKARKRALVIDSAAAM